MKPLFFLLMICFSRAVLSMRFLASVCGITLVLFLTSFGMISPLSDVVSVVMTGGGGNIILVAGILPLIPFATTFASEWEERAASFWFVRSGVRNYAASKVIMSALSGTLATFAGIILYALILLIKLPLFSTITTGDAYAPLLEADMPVRYLLYSAAHLSLSSALFSVAALWLSTYIPSRFTAMAAPVVLYFALFRLTRFWDIPPYLQLGTVVEGTYHAGSPLASMLFKLVTVTLMCLLMGYGTVVQIRRRVRND
jgi:hypothetical protein